MAGRPVPKALLWVLAVLITLASAVYQRLSGPTYPLRASVSLAADEYRFRLTRTHEGSTDQPIQLRIADPDVSGEVTYFKDTADATYAKLRVKNQDGLPVVYEREFVFAKNRFLATREILTFEESFHARAYPIWNTQGVREEKGATWGNTWHSMLSKFECREHFRWCPRRF